MSTGQNNWMVREGLATQLRHIQAYTLLQYNMLLTYIHHILPRCQRSRWSTGPCPGDPADMGIDIDSVVRLEASQNGTARPLHADAASPLHPPSAATPSPGRPVFMSTVVLAHLLLPRNLVCTMKRNFRWWPSPEPISALAKMMTWRGSRACPRSQLFSVPRQSHRQTPMGRRAVEKRRIEARKYDRGPVGKKLYWTM